MILLSIITVKSKSQLVKIQKLQFEYHLMTGKKNFKHWPTMIAQINA
jgi:hypothetical protein